LGKRERAKKAKSPKLYLHVIIHGALALLFLGDTSFWLLAVLLTIGHLAIDLIKIYATKEKNSSSWFIIDQVLHLILIVFLWFIWFKPEISSAALPSQNKIWLVAFALYFITQPTSILLAVIMKEWSKSIHSEGDKSLKNAGKYIGVLERLLVFLFIITNHWEGVGFLLAAKSVFRFGDLKESKERKLTEYILIGTLLSFAIAIIAGIAVEFVIKLA